MQWLTARWWKERLRKRSEKLKGILKDAVDDPKRFEKLELWSTFLGKSDASHCAPFFHYTKRVARAGDATLREDSERIEAELRFISGLFLPLLLFAVEGCLIATSAHNPLLGWTLVLVCVVGIVFVFWAFPERRIREVEINYMLAIMALDAQRRGAGRHGAP